jgi:TonB family protein
MTHMNVDYDFLSTTGMSLITGRNISPSIASDSVSAFLINETAARHMGWNPAEALGKKLAMWGKQGEVIGVVKDFHFRPMTETIEPFLFRYRRAEAPSGLFVKAKADRVSDAIYGLALLRDWVPPVYPVDALKAKRSGMVNVRLIVDETGKVTAARALEDSDEEFVEPALAAVREWSFAPAIERGKEVACCLDTLVMFSPAVGQQKPSPVAPESQTFAAAERASPQPRFSPPGEVPAVLQQRRLSGQVTFGTLVTKEGRAQGTRILGASHADFVLPALEALERWEFEPGRQGDLVMESPIEGRVAFETLAKPEEVYAANGITGPDGAAPSHTPLPQIMADPIWPLDLLLSGQSGSATVAFTVTASGGIRDLRVKEATHPEFGDALMAAVETWAFERPFEPGKRVTVDLEKRAEFNAPNAEGNAEESELARLVAAVRDKSISTAKGLDGKLLPLYRVLPVYPNALLENGRPAGRADLEFVIDRKGRVRLPRVLNASHPEFGWAAATALAQWVFTAPVRGGEAVDVRVRMPLEFPAPAE